jgi:hypothetical protein
VARRTRIWACFGVVAVLVVPLLGCSGDEAATTETAETRAKPVDGSFVGQLSRGDGFVAVVAAPPAAGEEEREVEVLVVDGSSVSEWFSGPISDNAFVAESEDGDAEARGKLTAETVTGTVELSDGTRVRYSAGRPAGAAGLYDLSISRRGKLTGASAGGLGLRGTIKLPEGTGTLRLADGRRLKLNISEAPATDLAHLGAGQVRLIVLPDGQLSGAGKSRPAAGGGERGFFIRSSPS